MGIFSSSNCGLALVMLSVVHGATREATAAAAGSNLHLESGYFFPPIRLQGDPSRREIRSIRVVGKVSSQGDIQGEIWLDSRPADLNAFGDAGQRVGPVPDSMPIDLRYLATGEVTTPLEGSRVSVGFRLYDLIFAASELNGHFKLVLGTTNLGPHRLLVYGGATPDERRNAQAPTHIVPLYGDPPITSVLPDAPLSREIDLTACYTASDGRLRRLGVRGVLGGKGIVDVDPNCITFDKFGEGLMQSAMGYPHNEVTLEPLEGQDPLRQGRRLYRTTPAPRQETNGSKPAQQPSRAANRFTLVLGPTEIGPHRIISYDDRNRVAFVTDAKLTGRRHQEEAAAQYATLSSGEQQAVADLRRAIGYNFTLRVEGNRGIEIIFSGDSVHLPPAGILSRLTNLHSISFYGGRFPAPCLADLAQLASLRSLFFGSAQFQPEGLAMLKDLRQLETLHFYMCPGINDDGVKHLAKLADLKELRIYNEEDQLRPPAPQKYITDVGLAQLQGLVKLELLDLFGHDLSDASLRVLTGMTALRELALSGRGFTDAGLEGLARLPDLRNLRLFETSVTTNGVAALKARLPKLQIEAWGREARQG